MEKQGRTRSLGAQIERWKRVSSKLLSSSDSLLTPVRVHGAANRMVDFEVVRPIFRSYRTLQISLSSRKMRQTPGA